MQNFFKLLINSLYYTLLLKLALWHLYFLCISTVKTFCKSVMCIYNRHILHLSLLVLANHSCQMWLFRYHISLRGNIELNPSPKSNSSENFSVCHWNINSISAHNFSKVSILNVCTSPHSFDIKCLSGAYLDSSTCLMTRI